MRGLHSQNGRGAQPAGPRGACHARTATGIYGTTDPEQTMDTAPQRQMRLTRDHVARLACAIEDPGPQVFPNRRPATDEDYAATVSAIMSGAPDGPFWVFAYGSLIWNPAFDFVDRRRALARGWRRTFCLGWDYRFRGSIETPGLMLALDRGGQCKGVVFRLPDDAVRSNLDRLVRREMSMIPTAFPPRWIPVATDEGRIRALTFAIDRNSGRYVSGLSDEAVADVLATARGHWGSMAEYLHATVSQLEDIGIRDHHLWRIQELVAERIESTHGLPGPG